MNIINAHVHLLELTPPELRSISSLLSGIAVFSDFEALAPMLDPAEVIAQMDEAGIDQSVLYAVEAPIVYASNEYVHELCNRHPDRFIGFASLDPNSSDAPQVLESAVRNLGMRGLKLHPPMQDFFPNDPKVFPVYEKCVELDIPVVFHVGTTPFGYLCKLSQASPLLVDEVAVRFPRLRIMLTHLGTLWHNEAFMVVEKNPNVFIDTAAYLSEIRTILTPDLIDRIGADKIIFGTDYPMPYGGRMHRMKDFVDCLCEYDLPEETLAGFFHGNFTRLLHGDARLAEMCNPERLKADLRKFMGHRSVSGKREMA